VTYRSDPCPHSRRSHTATLSLSRATGGLPPRARETVEVGNPWQFAEITVGIGFATMHHILPQDVLTELFLCAYSDDDLLDDPQQIAWNDFLNDFFPTFCWSCECASCRSGCRVRHGHGYEA
jgi:hypothetical protein